MLENISELAQSLSKLKDNMPVQQDAMLENISELAQSLS
jgi:hypothetical protein